ncbi:MAG: DUF2911 domain-containing protein [Ekhidna sp.]|nr:DUF2911 domain-containing protein [Ekhidna sp.]
MKSIKTLTLFSLAVATVLSVTAQQDKSQRPSPPAQVSATVNETKITIDYSRPSKKGRVIFGELVEYGKVWRTGANETTWMEVSKDVTIDGKTLKAGKYGLFTIPNEDEWTIIFNKKWNGWGAYDYKKSEDVLRINVPTEETDEVVEVFTIDVSESGEVTLAWDQTQVAFSVE